MHFPWDNSKCKIHLHRIPVHFGGLVYKDEAREWAL